MRAFVVVGWLVGIKLGAWSLFGLKADLSGWDLTNTVTRTWPFVSPASEVKRPGDA